MSKQIFGTLASLAKILEDASDPESQLREDRRETKPKTSEKASSFTHKKKEIDPKRKAWYEKRLKEQSDTEHASASNVALAHKIPAHTAVTSAGTGLSGLSGLSDALAAVKEIKPKDGTKRPEPWRRKPGDPIF